MDDRTNKKKMSLFNASELKQIERDYQDWHQNA